MNGNALKIAQNHLITLVNLTKIVRSTEKKVFLYIKCIFVSSSSQWKQLFLFSKQDIV